jgi:uncharacterized protein YfaP (DUF2135 family)
MASVRVFVGLDYHDDEIQMCVVSADEKGAVLCNRRLSNSAAAVVAVASLHGVVQAAAIEAERRTWRRSCATWGGRSVLPMRGSSRG